MSEIEFYKDYNIVLNAIMHLTNKYPIQLDIVDSGNNPAIQSMNQIINRYTFLNKQSIIMGSRSGN